MMLLMLAFVGGGTLAGPVRVCLGGPTEAEPQVCPSDRCYDSPLAEPRTSLSATSLLVCLQVHNYWYGKANWSHVHVGILGTLLFVC